MSANKRKFSLNLASLPSTKKKEPFTVTQLIELYVEKVAIPLKFWLMPMLRNQKIAEDAVQYAGLELVRNYNDLRFLDGVITITNLVDGPNARAFLKYVKTAAWNFASHADKKLNRERPLGVYNYCNEDAAQKQMDTIDLVHTALAGINADYRTLLILHYIDQLDYDQIATQLGRTRGSIKASLFRARHSFARMLKKLDPPN